MTLASVLGLWLAWALARLLLSDTLAMLVLLVWGWALWGRP